MKFVKNTRKIFMKLIQTPAKTYLGLRMKHSCTALAYGYEALQSNLGGGREGGREGGKEKTRK